MINITRFLFLGLFVFLLLKGQMMLWFGLIIAGLIIALFFGRLYCGYICPMNTAMIYAEKLSKNLGVQTESKPKWLKNGYFTWIALFSSIISMLLLKNLLRIDLPILPLWLLVSVLITLRYKPEVFHNLICPFAGLFKACSQKSIFSRKVDPVTCIGCKKCEQICPSAAITVSSENRKAHIDVSLCHQCINCTEVCPRESISYKI